MQRFRLIGILLVTSLLVGCGVKFFYRNLDFFIPWYVDDFVELDNIQEDYLDKIISKHQSWHKKEQLPEYIKLLDELSVTVEKHYDKIDEPYVKNLSERFRSYYQSISDQILPDIITLLIGLSKEQIETIFKKIEDVNEEFVSENTKLSDEEFKKLRRKKLEKSIKRWIGRLDEEQLKLVDSWVDNMKRTDKLRHQFHLAWQDSFKKIMSSDNLEKRRSSLQELMSFSDRRYPDNLDALFEENKANSFKHIVKLTKSFSEKQRQRIVEKLRDLQDDLNTLAKE